MHVPLAPGAIIILRLEISTGTEGSAFTRQDERSSVAGLYPVKCGIQIVYEILIDGIQRLGTAKLQYGNIAYPLLCYGRHAS
jgi:hypothetical protein